MKTLIATTLLTVAAGLHGCNVVPTAPVDYTPIIACELGLAASGAESGPAPAPSPKPGDTCPNCKGTGKVGDGTVFVTCAACDGTGKVPQPKVELGWGSRSDPTVAPKGNRGKCGCNLDRKIKRADGHWVHEDCPCGLNCTCELQPQERVESRLPPPAPSFQPQRTYQRRGIFRRRGF